MDRDQEIKALAAILDGVMRGLRQAETVPERIADGCYEQGVRVVREENPAGRSCPNAPPSAPHHVTSGDACDRCGLPIGQWASSGEAAHGGTYSAWLLGYGSTHTESVSQAVTIPAGCSATLTFWVHIDSAETTTSAQYDKLTVTAGSTTLATLSNLNKASGYVQKSYSLNAFAGQTVTLKWNGTEDSSLQTSFVLDDLAVTLS